jgi:hypothetical protein
MHYGPFSMKTTCSGDALMSSLSFLAGNKALRQLRRDGMRPDTFKVVAGAAGGPKWLVLSQLDRVIFGEFFRERRDPLFLLGSSIGAWRFAAASQKKPLAAIALFEDAYIAQSYQPKPSAAEVTERSYEVLDAFLPKEGLEAIVHHPTHRLSMLAVRSRGPAASDRQLMLSLGLGGAGLGNIVSPRALKLFFERTLFYDPRSKPPFLTAPSFPAQAVSLTAANARHALMASGSIPLVMSGISQIAGAPAGVYRDGGIIDYHLNVPFLPDTDDQLVLFPHFEERLIPGWFDKHLPWRKPDAARMSHALVIAPSPEFIAKLPFQKIPDRTDFMRFQGRDAERFQYWRKVIHECQRLADELHEVITKGRIAERVRPLPS